MERASPIGHRIVVAGPATSGKSTLAKHLGQMLGIPVIELDALYWKPGWQSMSDEQFRERVLAVTEGERWIADGHYERAWPYLWPRAELVIWLDLPLRTLLWRGLVRSWRRLRRKELLWGTNRENIWQQLKIWDADRSLLAWVLVSYRARRRAYVAATVDPRWGHLRFVRLCSAAEVAQFTTQLATVLNEGALR